MLESLLPIIYLSDLVLILSMLLMEREDPNKALFWSLALIVFPIGGFVLYLFFGQTFYSRYAFRPRNTPEELMESLRTAGLDRIESDGEAGKVDAVAARTLDAAGAYYYTSDNDVKLYTDGNDKFRDLKEDLRNAERFIHLEYYIIRKDPLGDEIMDILAEKAEAGVEVRLLADALGYNTGPRLTAELKRAGGKVRLFHSTAAVLLSPKKNNRNHRKIAVIDGRIGYIGGFNIGVEYLGQGPMGNWRDSAVRIEGSAVIPLEVRFALDWRYASRGDIVADTSYYPCDSCGGPGSIPVQIVNGGPDMQGRNGIAFQYLMMIEGAKESILLHTPYLAPNEACMYALRTAAMRGVDVRIIIPDKADHPFVYWCNRKYAHDLMRDGVKVYEYRDGFVHSKTMVVDGRECSVGSANFDERSMELNFEANAMIHSKDVGKRMDDAFFRDLESCTEYTSEMYENRTFLQKIKTGISWLVSDLL